MKIKLLVVSFMMAMLGCAAPFSWEYVFIGHGTVGESSLKGYTISGSIHAGSLWWSVASTEGPFLGYKDETGFYLKQCDHQTTPMPIENNLWALSYYGEILSHNTMGDSQRIELCDWYDDTTTGGTLIETPEDFYLSFMVCGENEYSDLTWFGWLHLSVNENLEMSILDKGIGLNGEPVIVGVGPIPEPSTGMLLLVGLAFAGLSRRKSPMDFRDVESHCS